MKEKQAEQFKTVQEVAAENDCATRTVQKWCADNDVPYIGSGQRKQYMLYPKHEAEFKKREKPGRRWPQNEKKQRN